MYFLDLFSGIGGFALGAKLAGIEFEKHYFSEWDIQKWKAHGGYSNIHGNKSGNNKRECIALSPACLPSEELF